MTSTGSLQFLTRTSKPIPALEHLETDKDLLDSIKRLLASDECLYNDTGFMIDCELLVRDKDFYETTGILRTKWADSSHKERFKLDADDLVIKAFSVLPLSCLVDSADSVNIPTYLSTLHLSLHLPAINKYLSPLHIEHVESHEVYNMEDLLAVYENARKSGYEGLVIKSPSCVYKRGKKTGWWKMKPNDSEDGIVVGLVWGTKGLSNEGLVIGFEVELESGVLVRATGLTQRQKEEVTNKVLLESPSYYEGWQCEVSYMEKTTDGLLRHPSFKRWRGLQGSESEKV